MANLFAMLRPLDFSGYNVPHHTQAALIRYYEQGLEPGGFLRSVLSNDLFRAVAQADYQNQQFLSEIVKFIYNEMPSRSHGSDLDVDLWIKYVTDLKAKEIE